MPSTATARGGKRTAAVALAVALGLLVTAPLAAGSGIAAGPDGSIWYGGVRRSADDTYRQFRTPQQLSDITIGPDGNLWAMEYCGRAVRVTPTGVVSTFPSFEPGTADTECDGKYIVSGPDGNVWFTADDWIGRITLNPPPAQEGCRRFTASGTGRRRTLTCGIYTLFPVPGFTGDLTVGSEGNLWFATDTGYGSPSAVGRFSPATRAVKLFRVPAGRGDPFMITTGADGNVWFTTNRGGPWLGRMSPVGSLRWVRTPGVRTDFDITGGPDGNLWFPCTTERTQAICRMSPFTGRLDAFPRPLDEAEGAGITSGTDGNLWFTEPGRGRLARITPAGVISEFPPTPVHLGVSPLGTRAVRVRLLCPAASPGVCRGAIELNHADPRGGRHRAGSARYRLRPGERGAFVVPLWRRWRQRLLAHGHLTLWVNAGRTFPGSPNQMVASTQARAVRLRAPAGNRREAVPEVARPPAVAG